MLPSSILTIFQSTLPRGERPQTLPIHSKEIQFQSTLPRGERRRFKDHAGYKERFQSTLPRGERHKSLQTSVSSAQFQSTLPRGERRYLRRCRNQWCYFNPRSHEGSDSNFRQKVLFSLSKNCLKYLILTTNYFN